MGQDEPRTQYRQGDDEQQPYRGAAVLAGGGRAAECGRGTGVPSSSGIYTRGLASALSSLAAEFTGPALSVRRHVASDLPSLGENTELVLYRVAQESLILTMYDSEQYFFEALAVGASGYVLKSVADRDLVEACRATMRDEPFIYPGAVNALIRNYLDRLQDGHAPPARAITDREEEILKLVAEGHTSQEIAEFLVISPKAVESHRANLLQKLGLKDRLELTRYAIRVGLIEP
ncbi:response regulator transcription factor [Streptomyces chartreusis]|uniref:response regulator transcription factor n=1 Tax=Streptomyces chartreusis TaxID=1969 RepID=UPI002E16D709